MWKEETLLKVKVSHLKTEYFITHLNILNILFSLFLLIAERNGKGTNNFC